MGDNGKHTDGLSLFHNIDRMEESKSQLSTLIERLDRESNLDEVGNLVWGMGDMLGNVFEQNHVMQQEMKALLQSAKNGLLSNEQIVEAFSIEMKRGLYLGNIVSALKMQIESLFNAIVNNEDVDGDDDSHIDKVTDNVNMLWKSVNSLTTIIDSTPKTLDTNIQRIQSEVIAPIRSLQHQSKHKMGSRSMDEEEQFAEKLGQMKQVLEKRKEMKLNSPAPGKQGGNMNKGFGANSNDTNMNKSNPSSYEANQSNKQNNYANNSEMAPSPAGSVRSQSSAVSSNTAGQSNRYQGNGQNANRSNNVPQQQQNSGQQSTIKNIESDDSFDNRNRQGGDVQNAPSSSSVASNSRFQNDLPGQSFDQSLKADDVRSSRTQATNKNNANLNIGENAFNAKSADFDDNASIGSQRSLGNNSISHQSYNDSIASLAMKGGETSGRSFAPGTASDKSLLNQSLEPAASTKSSSSHGISKSFKGSHGKVEHTSSKKQNHDSNQVSNNGDGTFQFPFGVPSDIKELMRVIKEKEAVLIKKEAELESEIKQRVKEYIREHGIGFPRGKIPTGEQDGVISGPTSQMNTERSLTKIQPGGLTRAPSQVFRRDADDNSTIESGAFPYGNGGKGSNREASNAETALGSPSRNAKSAPSTRPNDSNGVKGATKTISLNKPNGDDERPKTHDGSSPIRTSYGGMPTTPSGTRTKVGPSNIPLDGELIKYRLNIEENDPNKDRIYDIIDILVNNINYRQATDTSGKAFDSVDLIKFATPLIKVRQDAACDTSDLIESMRPLKELRVYDHPADFFMTRTYKITPDLESLWSKIQASDNVLAFFLTEFLPFLSPSERMRLNFAALPYQNRLVEEDLSKRPSSASPTKGHQQQFQSRSREWFTLSEEIVKGMSILHQECAAMLPLMAAIERISNDIIHFVKSMRKAGVTYIEDIRSLMSHNSENVALLQRSLIDLYRLFGDLQAREIAHHVRLYEYRAFFERVQIQGERALKELFRDFPSYESAFTAFTQCQGFVFEIHKRLLECRDRCQRYEVFRLMVLSQQQLSHQLSQAASTSLVENAEEINRGEQPSLSEQLLRSGIVEVAQQRGSVVNAMVEDFMKQGGYAPDNNNHQGGSGGAGRHPHESMEAYCHRLEHELKKCEQDVENLEIDLLHIMKEQDKTPPAILFFSLLHDPSFVPNLQQLSLQFNQLKGFVNQTIDMDFLLLKKRLQVCLTVLPSIDKLVDKYAALHKRWSQQRLNFFSERKLRGSAADNMSTCPLCYHDLMSASSVVPASVLPENQIQEGSNRAASSQSRTRSKFKALTAAAAAHKQ